MPIHAIAQRPKYVGGINLVVRLFRNLPIWKRLIAFAYTLAITTIIVKAGSTSDPEWWLIELIFLVWLLAPILVPLLHQPKMKVNGVAIAMIATYSIFEYVTVMFGPGARSTSALIFFFLPLYQWAVAVVVILLGLVESYARGQTDD